MKWPDSLQTAIVIHREATNTRFSATIQDASLQQRQRCFLLDCSNHLTHFQVVRVGHRHRHFA